MGFSILNATACSTCVASQAAKASTTWTRSLTCYPALPILARRFIALNKALSRYQRLRSSMQVRLVALSHDPKEGREGRQGHGGGGKNKQKGDKAYLKPGHAAGFPGF